MEPIDFRERNRVLQAPEGMENCIPLPVYNNGEFSLSVWKFSVAEIAEFNRTGRLFLAVYFGDTQPPVWLTPFKPHLEEVPGLPFTGPVENGEE
jgi:hypothetical protein